MVIVVPDATWTSAIGARLSEHRTLQTVGFETADGHPEQVLARVRRRHGSAPVAYVASSELEALDAIDAGADEALYLQLEHAAHALVLIDRAAKRAAKRLALEESHNSAVRAEKLAALETVVAAVAHEINNPLAAVSLSAEYLRGALLPNIDAFDRVIECARRSEALSPEQLQQIAQKLVAGRAPEMRRVLDDLLDMVDGIAAIVRDLRTYARSGGEDALEWVAVAELIDQVLRIMGSELSAVALIERDYALDLPRVLVPRSRIIQVLTNLLVNASHAMRDIERPVHRLRITLRADDEAVAISLSDTGSGIEPGALERIFDPYFTTKREGRGTGLGLSISRSILLRIGGDLMVESVHGEGATFIVFIPRTKRDAVACGELPPNDKPALVRRPALLLVEDDERLLRIYPRLLRDQFDILTAADGQEAIDLLSSCVNVDAIISDLNMPAVDGEQLYRWLAQHRPALIDRLLFVTGAREPRDNPFLSSISNAVLEKPISSLALIAAIQALLAKSHGRAAE
jgi:signal transduction histidine kinase/CheY-like chemotaxis protein